MENRKLSKAAWVVLAALIVVLVVAGYFLKSRFITLNNEEINLTYQAVFLTNGQVYFGKISKVNSDYIVLKNIYYLQANDSLQGTTSQTQPFTLVKLGKELHGPTDNMYINREQVLFYEDLREDSSVVQAINNYKP